MLVEVDGAQVADRDLVVGGVERDFGAEIAGMHQPRHAVGERTLQASLKVIQGDPVSNSMEHLAPQIGGGNRLARLDFATRCARALAS